ncbi:MAG: glycosyltransferase [Phycisphaerae bacterium]|nr:glycosyltransferase [Phycisphaerae bacterium]MDW8261548.1 glycosyltransferase [Phycisphaerales bacterium]
MKVAFLSASGELGGAERCLLDLIRGLRRELRKFDPMCILPEEGPLAEALRQLGVSVEVVELPKFLASTGDSGERSRLTVALRLLAGVPAVPAMVRRLRRLLVDRSCDLVHSNGVKTHLLSALAVPRTMPLLWHLHDFVGARPVAGALLRAAAVRPVTLVANSRAVAEDAAQRLRLPSVRHIHNAIDLTQFVPESLEGSWLDSAAGLEPAGGRVVRVGLVATYARWKGQDQFIDAVAQLGDSIRQAGRFYIIGGPIYRTRGSQWTQEELHRRIRERGLSGCLGLVGFQSDPARVMRSLDVVVHASTRPEPFGLTIAEAMAAGRAVVAVSAGGSAELFRPGIDALAIRPGSVPDLREALARLIADESLRRRLGASAAVEARKRFDLHRFAGEFAGLYRNLAGIDDP